MKSLLRNGVLAASTLALGLAVAPVASADPVQTVVYTSEDGAWPLEGSASYSGPGDEIRVWVNEGILKIDVQSGFDDLRVELSAPAGETLHPGAYPGARHRESSEPATANPGFFTVTGNFGCGDDYADFTIDRLDRAADGKVTDLDATFVQHCGTPDGPATHGEAHFHA
ncbi:MULTISPECIES: hypothetical protein [unclassified Amycolatopsis]|uniref:hypothetical protein n=1 Tax=unclassified Amycolatopsis TaxID=2618356 RepID=UPI002E1AA0D7|nr:MULTISPECIES: hypothetical protein [unclassified Amycolatopsis]